MVFELELPRCLRSSVTRDTTGFRGQCRGVSASLPETRRPLRNAFYFRCRSLSLSRSRAREPRCRPMRKRCSLFSTGEHLGRYAISVEQFARRSLYGLSLFSTFRSIPVFISIITGSIVRERASRWFEAAVGLFLGLMSGVE